MLHKPAGIVSQRNAPGLENIYSLLESLGASGQVAGWRPGQRPGAVGRLDRWTSGLIVFTDDSELNARLCTPGICSKRYVVTVKGNVSDSDLLLDGLREPYRYERRGTNSGLPVWTRPAEVRALESWREPVPEAEPPWLGDRTRLEFRLIEGRHRQIRRLCSRAGLRLLHLHREAVGPLELGGLASGAARPLSAAELEAQGIGP